MNKTSFALWTLGTVLASPASSRAQDDGTRSCRSSEHRSFDFLLGDWHVQPRAGGSSGTVSVTSILDGCAIQEVWSSPGGRTGQSVNAYATSDGQWHQAYVDTTGTVLRLAGGIEDGAMVLFDDTERTGGVRNRYSWRPLEDGAILQRWERSAEADTWSVEFEAIWSRSEIVDERVALSGAMQPLAALVGRWEVTPVQYDETGQEPSRSPTIAQARAILNGKFVEETAELDLPVGRVAYVLLVGYDPFQKAYRLSWNDSLAGLADVYQGSIENGVLTLDNLESETFWHTPDGKRYAFRLEYELELDDGERRARVYSSEDEGRTWSLYQTLVYRKLDVP